MRARVGDLAIARFDNDSNDGNKYDEQLCLVTGSNSWRGEYEFITWEPGGRGTKTTTSGSLPRSRLLRVRPKIWWYGSLLNLALDDVECI